MSVSWNAIVVGIKSYGEDRWARIIWKGRMGCGVNAEYRSILTQSKLPDSLQRLSLALASISGEMGVPLMTKWSWYQAVVA